MMHLRSTFEVVHRAAARAAAGWGCAPGVGFAEVSVAADQVGFQFGDPDATKARRRPGPRRLMSAQWTRPLAGKAEAIATFTIGSAYVDGAPELVLPRDRVQPFASFEVGVGW
jgi:hypothetical protein